MAKISILIPVYNVEKYLGKCLESVIKQTLEDIEIICVNDGSTDNSLQLLYEYAGKDKRIKVINLEKNRGLVVARKEGVKAATGNYIMFLDSDDSLELDACEILYQEQINSPVDILHFDINVIDGGAGEKVTLEAQKYMALPKLELSGRDILESCFRNEKYKWNVWGKLYTSEVCKKAFGYASEEFFMLGEDVYLYFLVSYFAKTYRTYNGKKLYNYCYGAGSTGGGYITIDGLERYCASARVIKYLSEFMLEKDILNEYEDILSRFTNIFLDACIDSWFNRLNKEDAPRGFSMLIKCWSEEKVVSYLASRYQVKTVADRVAKSEILQSEKKEVKTLGIFYHRMKDGGVERVISLLMPLYIKMGYKVVLFTEVIDNENDYCIPNEVERIKLPVPDGNDYMERAQILGSTLKKYNIDIIMYHAVHCPYLLWDLLMVKTKGTPFMLIDHSIFAAPMMFLDKNIEKFSSVYRLTDSLVALSKTEANYWKLQGINSFYISNPIEKVEIVENTKKDYILWVGRLDENQKQPIEAIKIMKNVVEKVPTAKLVMVGGEYSKGITKILKSAIKKNNLEDNIVLEGYQSDVKKYYEKAKIHLMTSAFEAFPMVVIESKAWGIPLVMYDLPYVELIKSGQGCIKVEQDNVQAAADAIIQLLLNEEKYEEMALEAKESLKEFEDVDLAKEWRKIIDNTSTSVKMEKEILEENIRMIETLNFYYTKGCRIPEKAYHLKQWLYIGKCLLISYYQVLKHKIYLKLKK